ncbi:MAG: PQQ-binding-like beta-propeller repeat protein, partial [Opitutales bacterium]|nr:PQQ-binding-like beta-propeller repeat protein [Opitutales bacterium]
MPPLTSTRHFDRFLNLPLLPLLLLISAMCMGADRNWPTYLGDNASSQYSSLTQITPSNVAQLEVAWTFDASQFPTKNRFHLECNPLIIDGTLYGTGGNKMLFALDAATGELIWRFDPYEIEHGDNAPNVNRTWANRGVHYWSDGKRGRIIYSSQHLLCAVDADTGQLIPSFGNEGFIDLRKGLGRDVDDLAYAPTTPGVVFENLLILGSRVTEALPASPGHIRAFDIRTGEQVWRFNTIPHPGEFGYDTWPEDAYLRAGGANTWTGMALDEERGLVYCPTGSPSFDYYGGDRIGQNLFGNSLICLDVKTGKRKWHFQAIHHDIFDMDLPSPPNLFTMRRDGKEIPAISLLTKHGYVFVFNRVTGDPLFPIEEVPVPASKVPGENAWPTQPHPVKPVPYS